MRANGVVGFARSGHRLLDALRLDLLVSRLGLFEGRSHARPGFAGFFTDVVGGRLEQALGIASEGSHILQQTLASEPALRSFHFGEVSFHTDSGLKVDRRVQTLTSTQRIAKTFNRRVRSPKRSVTPPAMPSPDSPAT